MSDFEGRVTEMLRAEADGAPDALGLAGAARTRARAKRRTRLGAVGAGAQVARTLRASSPFRPGPTSNSTF